MLAAVSRLVPLEDGWLAWADEGRLPASVRVKVREADDGRFHVSALHVDGAVSAEVLRAIPVGRIEAAANAQFHHRAPGSPARQPRARIRPSLRSNAVQGYPNAFYEAVATTYRHLSATSSRPVAALAEANEVPVTTAQRWVKEARRRGLLAPGRPGKAG
ncbi:MAG TPA: hypothetical protein VFJ61_04535 [Solirubrobacterales bacterium]|nr:hypothetical protein [Solirubrobacterales bacterium]